MDERRKHVLKSLAVLFLVAIVASAATIVVAVPIISNTVSASYTITTAAPVNAGVLTQVAAPSSLNNPTGMVYSTITALPVSAGSVYSGQWYKSGFRFYSVNGYNYPTAHVQLKFQATGVINSGTASISMKYYDLNYGTWSDISFTYNATTHVWGASMPTSGFVVPSGYNSAHTVLMRFDFIGSITMQAWIEQV